MPGPSVSDQSDDKGTARSSLPPNKPQTRCNGFAKPTACSCAVEAPWPQETRDVQTGYRIPTIAKSDLENLPSGSGDQYSGGPDRIQFAEQEDLLVAA
jgi:hypothetical protein